MVGMGAGLGSSQQVGRKLWERQDLQGGGRELGAGRGNGACLEGGVKQSSSARVCKAAGEERRGDSRPAMGENCRAKEVQPRRSGTVKTRTLPGQGLTETSLSKGPRRESWSGAGEEDVRPRGGAGWSEGSGRREFTRDRDGNDID